jgi:hypothetical protein
MKAIVRTIITMVFASSLGAVPPAPSSPPMPPVRPPACVSPEFRQFDFWLGHWKVTNPSGKEVGTSDISRVSEGCALREQWTSASGKGGTSINYYDAAEKQWRQDWVGGDGTILHLHGGLEGASMVLTGKTKSARGPLENRITWTSLAGGKVQQEWATSEDNGGSWQVGFVGIYEKQP